MSTADLQISLVTVLKADTAVNALIDGRVYDTIPPTPTFPYVSLGPEQELPSRADCYDGKEIHFQVDAWSRAVGFPQVKRISGAVIGALNDASLSITGYRLVEIYLETSNTVRDPDGLTSHTAMTFRALIEPV